jgi:hypothetical protein
MNYENKKENLQLLISNLENNYSLLCACGAQSETIAAVQCELLHYTVELSHLEIDEDYEIQWFESF